MSQELNDMRARDAKAKAAFFEGKSDRHPHGLSGARHLIPREDTKNCWDTSPGGSNCSEWGNLAGMTP